MVSLIAPWGRQHDRGYAPMLTQFVLTAYTSLLLLQNLYLYERYSGGLPSHPCTLVSPARGVPQQVRILLLVTLWCVDVLARLSLDNTLPLGGCDLAA